MKIRVILFFVCLHTALFAQVNGNALFDNSFVHEIRLDFAQASYFDSLDLYSQNDLLMQTNTYLMATVTIDGAVLDSIGARYKGFSSNFQNVTRKRPFKLDFAEFVDGQRYDGLKKVNLNNGFGDPTFLRDALSLKLLRGFGVASSRTAFANLYVNDTLLGFYVLVEQVDNKFLENWFQDNDGELYKCKVNTDFDYYGDSLLYAQEFEQQNNNALADWINFDRFVYTFNFPNAPFQDSLNAYLNVPSFVKSMAVDYAVNQSDGFGQSGNNFYLYRNPLDSVFYWIPWDYNLSFYNDNPIIPTFDCSGASFYDCPKLLKSVLEDAALRQHYYTAICEFNLLHYDTLAIFSWMDTMQQLIEVSVLQDSLKFFPNMADFYDGFEAGTYQATLATGNTTSLRGLKPVILSRKATITNDLQAAGFSCFAGLAEVESSPLLLYPNPSIGNTVRLHGACSRIRQVYDAVGRAQTFEAKPYADGLEIRLLATDAGCYYIECESAGRAIVLKWIVR